MTRSSRNMILVMAIAAAILLSSNKTNAMGVSYLGSSNLPRGMRNNNPGNIRISSANWKGKIPSSMNTDGAFEQFESYVWGVRAMIKLLQNYIRQGHDTIRKIITRYAPSSENDTSAYIAAVSQNTGIPADTAIFSADRSAMQRIVTAMAHHENGRQAITSEMFNEAWQLL